jgi:hypothetical protein
VLRVALYQRMSGAEHPSWQFAVAERTTDGQCRAGRGSGRDG